MEAKQKNFFWDGAVAVGHGVGIIGGVIGAGVGTLMFPIVGTIIGIVIGYAVGLIGSFLIMICLYIIWVIYKMIRGR